MEDKRSLLLLFIAFCALRVPSTDGLQRLNASGFASHSFYFPSPIVESRSMMLNKLHYVIHDNFVNHLFTVVPMGICGITFHGPEDFSFSNSDNVQGHVGSLVNNSDTVLPPVVEWFNWENNYFSLAMFDFDSPDRKNPIHRSWLHWLVMNIEEDNVEEGETIAEYIGTWPEKGTGIHRYVIMVFKQTGKFNKTMKPIPKNDFAARRNFNSTLFAQKWNLSMEEEDFSIDFFTAQYCPFVDEHYKHLISEGGNYKT